MQVHNYIHVRNGCLCPLINNDNNDHETLCTKLYTPNKIYSHTIE